MKLWLIILILACILVLGVIIYSNFKNKKDKNMPPDDRYPLW
jgi:hypothetical protein